MRAHCNFGTRNAAMPKDDDKIATIATLSRDEVLGWFRFVTGFYCTGRNWLPGEKAALIQRAEVLRLKIEGLNA